MKKWLLWIVAAVLLVIPVFFWSQLLSGADLGGILYDGGRLLSLAGFVLIFIQYVLSARLKWLEKGIGQDKFFIIHRLSGIVGLVLILVHPAFLFSADLLWGIPFSIYPLKLVGVMALLCLVVTAGGALAYQALKCKYETWKALHWASYAILPLGFVHSFFLGSTLQSQPVVRVFWIVLAILYVAIIGCRVWTAIRVRRSPYRIGQVRRETHDTWSLTFEGPRIDYQPGQFMRVQLIRKNKVEPSHPFTIASSPTQKHLSITVKAVGDFTRTIKDTRPGDRAYVDAPYGAFSFLGLPDRNHDADNLVFIAGGIGVTPFMSMLRYLRDKGLKRNVTLIWGNKNERDMIFKKELEALVKQTSLKVVHVMSMQEDWAGEKGYVDEPRLKRLLDGVDNPQVFVCGPPVMMRLVMRALRGVGIPRGHIHSERFSLR